MIAHKFAVAVYYMLKNGEAFDENWRRWHNRHLARFLKSGSDRIKLFCNLTVWNA